MSAALHRLGALMVRGAPWVVIGWVVVAVALVLIANSAGRPTNNDLTLPGTGSTEATDLLDKDLPDQANGSVPIVIETKTGTLASGSNKTVVENTVKSLAKNKYVRQAISPYSDQASDQITKDGKIAYIALALKVSSGDLDESEAQSVLDAAEPAKSTPGLEVSAGGYLGQELSSPSTHLSEVIGVLAALIVLLFTFRTLHGGAAGADHRRRRAARRPRHRRTRRPCNRRADDRADARHHARPRRGDGLLAVHHQPPPAADGRGGRPTGASRSHARWHRPDRRWSSPAPP